VRQIEFGRNDQHRRDLTLREFSLGLARDFTSGRTLADCSSAAINCAESGELPDHHRQRVRLSGAEPVRRPGQGKEKGQNQEEQPLRRRSEAKDGLFPKNSQ
jgi:hypothetical protein